MPLVNLTELPDEVLDQIPISIQVNGPIYELSLLPRSIKYIVQQYLNTIQSEPVYKKVYDIEPKISPYQDYMTIESKRQLIKTYFNNFLQVHIGSYPFDVNEGCRLKEHLQTKDTSLRQTLISNDIHRIVGVLGQDYNINVQIQKVSVIPIKKDVSSVFSYVDEQIQIILKVEDEDTIIELQ